MSVLDWFTGGTKPAADVAAGTVRGTLEGISTAANGLREAITGRLDADGQAKFDMFMADLESKLAIGNQAINLADANSGSNFRGGWRPAIGWTCAISLFAYYVPPVLMATALWGFQCISVMMAVQDITKCVLPAFPIQLNLEQVLGLTATLLGSTWIRSWDKKNGTAK